MPEPEIPQRVPYVVRCAPGKYAWCSCGRSSKQPYCDGSHGGTGFVPIVETIEEERTVPWCGCKKTGKPPYCDGSHARLS
jgi:CDGSH-type Zn-finger protein